MACGSVCIGSRSRLRREEDLRLNLFIYFSRLPECETAELLVLLVGEVVVASTPRALSLPRARRPHTDRVIRNMGCGASTAKHGAKSVLMTSVPSVDAKTMRRIRRRSCAVGLQASPTKSTRQVTKFVPNDVELIKED